MESQHLSTAERIAMTEAMGHSIVSDPEKSRLFSEAWLAARAYYVEDAEPEGARPLIYCFINSGKGTDWVRSMALAEDGTCLAQHVSSSDEFARIDSGFAEPPRDDIVPMAWGPNCAKREKFAEHYPDGYTLEWVDDPRTHEGLQAAYALNQQAARMATTGSGGENGQTQPT